jgi:hypothetical protein
MGGRGLKEIQIVLIAINVREAASHQVTAHGIVQAM